eukprot:GFUD01010055.1.p1 GENE.GFUD01010055.1~~GFUD01010055.1.p1  ORF type:complete len:782 (-),score=232.97 GFUD01010055.1:117-2462(-)
MPPPPPPHLTLDNFNIESEVPENCPFVLTSPRSLEACRRAGVQPVSLLPTTLQEYEDALPDLPREKVLAIFREVETAKEGKLSTCREFRRQIIWEEEQEAGDDRERGLEVVRQRFEGGRGARKLSCLSPIVEHVGGRDSALGTSQSGTGSQEDSPGQGVLPERARGISSSPLSIYLEDNDLSDQPESDQHVNFPKNSQEGLTESEVLFDNLNGSEEHLANLGDNLSRESLESDVFFSDLMFSETPSPVGFEHRERDRSSSLVEDWRSCPELDKERVGSFSDLSQIEFTEFSFTEKMEKSISKSAHTLKALDVNSGSLSQTYRRTSSHSKKKASRSERLTSESLQSLYDAVESSKSPDEKCQEDDCPESERFCTSSGENINRVGCSLPLSPLSTGCTKSPWHHNKSLAVVSPGNSCLVRSALSRSDIDIDQLQISQQDLRILEILALRNNEEQDRRQKQHKLRIQWEEEKCKRELEKSELEKEYRKQLTAKRRKENDDCQRRLQQARERFIRSQEYLRQLLKEKDDRKKELIVTIVRHKEALIRGHQEQEDSKRVAVDNAVKDLLNRDTQYRNELKKQVEEKLKKAERNRKQHEMNRALSLTESNRLEVMEHQLRVKKLEEIYEDHIEKIKRTIEKKLKQASDLLRMQKYNQKSSLDKNSKSYAQAMALKSELEAGLDLWRKQVLSVQSQSIRRAEERVRNELESRREKLAEEMRSREQKCLEKRKEKEEEKKMRIMNAKKKIEEKEKKIEKLLSEREQSIIRARKMAETSAKLRELIKTYQ